MVGLVRVLTDCIYPIHTQCEIGHTVSQMSLHRLVLYVRTYVVSTERFYTGCMYAHVLYLCDKMKGYSVFICVRCAYNSHGVTHISITVLWRELPNASKLNCSCH